MVYLSILYVKLVKAVSKQQRLIPILRKRTKLGDTAEGMFNATADPTFLFVLTLLFGKRHAKHPAIMLAWF
jgi:hypothetical protein